MRLLRHGRLAALLCLCVGGCGDSDVSRACTDEGGYEITRARVLAEENDREALTRWPDPSYRTGLASSYDRRSTAPGSPGWFENADFRGFVRDDEIDGRTEHVMLELEGPGVLTRIWSATPRGVIRVYLDGADEPAIERPFAELFDAGDPPFVEPSTYRISNEAFANCKASDLSGGANSYAPILFSRSIRVTIAETDELYYQLSWRLYPEGTRVQPDGARACLAKARGEKASGATVTRRAEVSSETPLRISAPAETGGVIRELRLTPEHRTTGDLRATIVELVFDGALTARGPLAEFFGSGPDLRDVESALTTMRTDGALEARFPMPFRERAELRLYRADGARVRADVEIEVAPYRWDDESFYLHARWTPHREVPAHPPSDQTLLEVEGRGVYLGNVLNATNSSRAWWGEGDERFYVDGETFPSHFGTGTEDYYGYAWCSAVVFARPYHGQTRVDGPETHGRISLYRWHVLDRIPFEHSFRFDLEVTHWKRYGHVSFEALHFWYGDPQPITEPPDPRHYVVPPIAEHPADDADPDDIPHRP